MKKFWERTSIVKRVTNIKDIKHGKMYVITDPKTGEFAKVRAEITEEQTIIKPRSIVFIELAGTLPIGLLHHDYTIDEIE